MGDMTLAEVAYLQEESAQHRSILEQQASGLTLQYNQRKAQEDMMMRQYQIQKQYYDNSLRLQGMQTQVQQGVIPQGLFGGSVARPGGSLAGATQPAMMATGATQQAMMATQAAGAPMVASVTQPAVQAGGSMASVTQGVAQQAVNQSVRR